MDLALAFLAALSFSGHCAGMCGFFPAALRAGGGTASRVVRVQAAYHAGKISAYVSLGFLAAAWGRAFVEVRRPAGAVSGALLLLTGWALVSPPAVPARWLRWLRGSAICAALSDLLRDPRPAAAFSVGVVNGFVPCGLVYAMAARAAAAASPATAALSMVAFGSGTIPVLLVAGLGGGWLPARLQGFEARRHLAWIAAGACFLLGAITIAGAFGAAPHVHAIPLAGDLAAR